MVAPSVAVPFEPQEIRKMAIAVTIAAASGEKTENLRKLVPIYLSDEGRGTGQDASPVSTFYQPAPFRAVCQEYGIADTAHPAPW